MCKTGSLKIKHHGNRAQDIAQQPFGFQFHSRAIKAIWRLKPGLLPILKSPNTIAVVAVVTVTKDLSNRTLRMPFATWC